MHLRIQPETVSFFGINLANWHLQFSQLIVTHEGQSFESSSCIGFSSLIEGSKVLLLGKVSQRELLLVFKLKRNGFICLGFWNSELQSTEREIFKEVIFEKEWREYSELKNSKVSNVLGKVFPWEHPKGFQLDFSWLWLFSCLEKLHSPSKKKSVFSDFVASQFCRAKHWLVLTIDRKGLFIGDEKTAIISKLIKCIRKYLNANLSQGIGCSKPDIKYIASCTMLVGLPARGGPIWRLCFSWSF